MSHIKPVDSLISAYRYGAVNRHALWGAGRYVLLAFFIIEPLIRWGVSAAMFSQYTAIMLEVPLMIIFGLYAAIIARHIGYGESLPPRVPVTLLRPGIIARLDDQQDRASNLVSAALLFSLLTMLFNGLVSAMAQLYNFKDGFVEPDFVPDPTQQITMIIFIVALIWGARLMIMPIALANGTSLREFWRKSGGVGQAALIILTWMVASIPVLLLFWLVTNIGVSIIGMGNEGALMLLLAALQPFFAFSLLLSTHLTFCFAHMQLMDEKHD